MVIWLCEFFVFFCFFLFFFLFFFFQAEDGIRDHCVTGVQTCALPIFIMSDSLRNQIKRANQYVIRSKKLERLGKVLFISGGIIGSAGVIWTLVDIMSSKNRGGVPILIVGDRKSVV